MWPFRRKESTPKTVSNADDARKVVKASEILYQKYLAAVLREIHLLAKRGEESLDLSTVVTPQFRRMVHDLEMLDFSYENHSDLMAGPLELITWSEQEES